ncbi:glypican-5 [Zootermopsis nevadensis]|uniref:glypican-5 n=1 Tax=Zootermopsis nevadensis TaxID=136037 RepID=UPI000B8E9C5C|nr:glypican-5 [Zootermopsis nevadensis]
MGGSRGLVLLVLVYSCGVVFSGRTSSVNTSCTAVKPILEMKNLSLDIPDQPVNGSAQSVCESAQSCCTLEMETKLRLIVRKDFQALLHHNSRSLEGLLASTAAKLQDHVAELARQSENKTMTLFSQVYQRMAILAREPIASLYSDLIGYLNADKESGHDREPDAEQPSAVATSSPSVTLVTADLNLEESVTSFFTSLFPLVYHHAVNPHLRDFSNDYKSCLRATMSEIQPFGDVPRQAAQGISKTMEATRVLLQALNLGAEVLNNTDTLLMTDSIDARGAQWSECHTALLRMSYCPMCQGLTRPGLKPCSGYCLNVLRGCLTQHASELDLPWNGFVEATERLVVAVRGHDPAPTVVLNVEEVIRSLDTRISEAIMYAMENGPSLERKVKRACGQARWADEDEHDADTPSGRHHVTSDGVTDGRISSGPGLGAKDSLATQLHHFLASLTKSRGFYANLAESLCSDESFAETRDTADCWNGQRIGEYTKTVVAATVNAQKYNPELIWTQRSPDPRIAQLSDKLRHIRQVVLSQLTLAPESDSYLQDEEGSGSGHPPVSQWIDDGEPEDPNWPYEGSASGDNPLPPGGDEKKPKSGSYDPSVNGNSILGGSAPPTHAAATKPTRHSCAVLVTAVLCRISLVLLNG